MYQRILKSTLALLIVATLLPAQNKEAAGATPAQDKQDVGEQPKDAAAPGAPVDPKTYKIGAEDVLMIRVWREPEVSGAVMVRPDGRITMPLVGELEAGGTTPEELEKRVTEALGKFVNTPVVMVAVQQVNSKKYYISGEVSRTGAFPLVVPTTVVQALSGAGGFREFANQKKIIIMRGEKRFTFNYKDFVKGKHLDQNIQLEHGDHIVVQ